MRNTKRKRNLGSRNASEVFSYKLIVRKSMYNISTYPIPMDKWENVENTLIRIDSKYL